MSEERSGAVILVESLARQGVEFVFGYPGGAVLPIYDEIFQQNDIRHILVRHEQGAVHMAEGYARSTGKPGVVLVTSGPGATNAVTGLTDALMDSIPIVCLTGQVPTHLIGNDAFQEADTTGITRPCTKHNYLVKAVSDLADLLRTAILSGEAGTVTVKGPLTRVSSGSGLWASGSRWRLGSLSCRWPWRGSSVRPHRPGSTPEAVTSLARAGQPIFTSRGFA